jgi:hypothetical protein
LSLAAAQATAAFSSQSLREAVPASQTTGMPGSGEAEAVIKTLATALNRADVEGATALFDDKAVVTLPDGRTYTGKDQIQALWQMSTEQPATFEVGDFLTSGVRVRFVASVKSGNTQAKRQIEAIVESGTIRAYTVNNGSGKPEASIAGEQYTRMRMGVVQSVRREQAYRYGSQTSEAMTVRKGVRATIGTTSNDSSGEIVPAAKYPTPPVPAQIITIKLDDGNVITVTQAEVLKSGDRVSVVSTAGQIHLLPIEPAEGSQIETKRRLSTAAPIAMLGQGQASGQKPQPDQAPAGVFYASWNQYQGFPTVLMPASQGICFLQGVTGNFRGAGESVWIRNNGTNWELNGTSQQQYVSAHAICVPFSSIQGADRGFNYMIGTAYAPVYYGGCSWWESCHGNSVQLDLWGLDSFCYLTGMGGAFNGGGEVVSVNAWAPDHWYMLVATQVEGATNTGEAGCLAPIGHPRPRETNVVNRYIWTQGQPFLQLPNADQAFCAFDWITGHFAGWGETVEIYHNPDNTQWLGGSSYQQDVSAQVSCMYYDQR